jgi:hypothetical protein
VAIARASALSFVRKKSINARSEARFCRRPGKYKKNPSEGEGIHVSSNGTKCPVAISGAVESHNV